MGCGASKSEEAEHVHVMPAIPGVGGDLIEYALQATHVLPLVSGFGMLLLKVKKSFEDIAAIARDAKPIIDWATEQHALFAEIHESLPGDSPVDDVLRACTDAAARSVEDLLNISKRITRDNSTLNTYLRAGYFQENFIAAKGKVEAMWKKLVRGLSVGTYAGVREVKNGVEDVKVEVHELNAKHDATHAEVVTLAEGQKELREGQKELREMMREMTKQAVTELVQTVIPQQSAEVQPVLMKAAGHLIDGDPEAAIDVLEDAPEEMKELAAVLCTGGLAHLEAGDPSAAIKSYEFAVKKDPQMTHAWMMLSKAYQYERGPCLEAIDALRKAIEVENESWALDIAHKRLDPLYAHVPDEVWKKAPLCTMLYSALAKLLTGLGNYDEAERIFRNNIALNNEHAHLHHDLAEFLADCRKDVVQAEHEYRVAISCPYGDQYRADAHFSLAMLLLKRRDEEEADEHFRRCIDIRNSVEITEIELDGQRVRLHNFYETNPDNDALHYTLLKRFLTLVDHDDE